MINSMRTYWQKTSANTRLWISVVVSGLIYLAFTLPFLLSRYYAVNPPVDYTKLTHYSAFGFVAYVAGIISLFALYIIGLRSLINKDQKRKDVQFILISAGVFALILLFSYPQTAIDLFVYAIRSIGWALYGLSPFATSPDAFPASDPWLGLAGEWADAASPYGPIWEWLSLGGYYLSSGSYLGHLFALKIIGALAYLGSIWLVYKTMYLIRPDWAVVGAAFFAWNPLVLFESVQNGHNDIVMVFFLMLAIWAYVRLMQLPAGKSNLLLSAVFITAFACSILVKFITLLILPFILVGLGFKQPSWAQRILVLVGYGAGIILLSVLVMAPYWPGLDNWAVVQSGSGAGRSLFALLVLTMIPRVSNSVAFDDASMLIYAVFGGIYLWGLWQVISQGIKKPKGQATIQDATLEISLRISFYVLFWYVLLVASVFHAWYLLWFVPLAALLIPQNRPISGTLVFSLMALLIIPYYETVRVWIPYLNRNHLLGHMIGVSLLLVPVLLSLCKPIQILPNEEPT
jgi:hypothetical protein